MFSDVKIPVVELEETYSVGVSFEHDYGRNVIGSTVVVIKRMPDGTSVVVHSQFHKA